MAWDKPNGSFEKSRESGFFRICIYKDDGMLLYGMHNSVSSSKSLSISRPFWGFLSIWV